METIENKLIKTFKARFNSNNYFIVIDDIMDEINKEQFYNSRLNKIIKDFIHENIKDFLTITKNNENIVYEVLSSIRIVKNKEILNKRFTKYNLVIK